MSASKHFHPTRAFEQKPLHRRGPAQKLPRPLSDVSFAGPSDLDALLAFLDGVREEIDGGQVEDGLIAQLARDLVNRVGGVAFVVRGTDGIEASLGLRAEHPLFSRSHYLRAVWNVVAPEARLTGHARSLLVEGRKFADSLGRRLLIEELTPDTAAGKTKLVARHLRQVGALFLYDPVTAA